MENVEKRLNERPKPSESDPWFRPSGPTKDEKDEPRVEGHERRGAPRTLPLAVAGSLGAIEFKGKAILDNKLAFQPEFKYDGAKEV